MSECSKNILCGFIFTSAAKNYVLHVLVFVESPNMCKTSKFYTHENLVPQGMTPGLNDLKNCTS